MSFVKQGLVEGTRVPADRSKDHLWIVGGGIAGMAAAAFAIRDARVPANQIHILEMLGIEGGSLDGGRAPNNKRAWVTRGARMLTEELHQCTWDLCDSIPSLEDPSISVLQETREFNKKWPIHAKARLIGDDHKIIDSTKYGFDFDSRVAMTRLLATPESVLGALRIEDMYDADFFNTNFWNMWRTTFAFQKWHSAAELRRYYVRLIQEFSRIDTLGGTRHTKYNQYDSMIVPLQRWLLAQGVDVRFGVKVLDADFENAALANPGPRRATQLNVQTRKGKDVIKLGANDYVLFTLGSITADTTYGGNDTVPELIRDRRDGSWTLWENLALKAKDFGNPIAFCGNVDEHKWESFTLTCRSSLLLDRMAEYTGNEIGSGGLVTWVNSGWHLSIDTAHQPHFPDMPEGWTTTWAYGFELDRVGDFVKKKMSEATGKEILIELVHQMGFEDILDEVLATTDVTTVMMPYASALFACRTPTDRPKVVPDRSANFGFLGQFVEMPEDVVFTVEYSVHTGMEAIYALFGVERQIPPIYHGLLDPKIGKQAVECLFK